MNNRSLFGFLLLFSALVSCSGPSSGENALEAALEMSGTNRTELEAVMRHYDSLGDAEKKQAAVFLITNMPEKRSLHFADTASHNRLIRYLGAMGDPTGWDVSISRVAKAMDSLVKAYPQDIRIRSDLQSMSAQYLINNIDMAFEAWRKAPWSQSYTFDDFCKYVLPYKLANEEPDNWRVLALNNALPTEDSILRAGDPWQMALALINNTGLYYNIGMGGFPYPMNFSDIDIARKGACGQMADLALYYFRSRGIPSAADFTPTWANRSSSHVWNVVILPGGKMRQIGYRPDGTNDLVYKVSKIYRNTYNRCDQPDVTSDEVLPNFMAGGDVEDVTAQYDMPLHDVTVELSIEAPAKNVYLGTFDNIKWVAVAHAAIKGSKAKFRDMGCGGDLSPQSPRIRYLDQGNGIVYLPMYSLKQGLCAAASPFILDSAGVVTTLTPSSGTQKVKLYRKYPKQLKFIEYEHAVVGARIEGANRADFSDADLLYTVSRAQQYPLEPLPIVSDKSYRYFRFVAQDTTEGYFAEFRLFSPDGERLTGKAISGHNALDDNILTSHYKGVDAAYPIVVDMTTPRRVGSVAIATRTDDNEIIAGQHYELFVWDGKWVSLGNKLADTYFLEYELPEGALFWLRNRSKGVEERIFTIQNGKQIWW